MIAGITLGIAIGSRQDGQPTVHPASLSRACKFLLHFGHVSLIAIGWPRKARRRTQTPPRQARPRAPKDGYWPPPRSGAWLDPLFWNTAGLRLRLVGLSRANITHAMFQD